MSQDLFSPSWYRVAGLKPRIRSHAQIHRQQYRGQTWYILQDLSTERFHRLSPAAYFIIGLMDGHRTVQEIWDIAAARFDDDAPTQDELIQLLSQLHAADALQCEIPPDTSELLRRHDLWQRRKWQSTLLSPLAWRFPLFNPERFLERFVPFVRPLVSWWGLAVWFAVVGSAVVLAAVHWRDLSQDIIDRILTPENLVLLWILFPVIKGLHELGHAFVTKAFGGAVHDMGVMVLVLTPLPYVDASSAWAFREKWRRVAVGAAGIVVELFLAAMALFLWLNIEPGIVRSLAYNAIVIAGASSVLFNGNPLLRYDGYYILADLLEIPNLRARATAYFGYLGERYLFGRTDAETPEATPAEKVWFVTFGVSSFLYRVLIIAAILLFVARKFFFVGLLLSLSAAFLWVVVPAGKGLVFLFTSPRLRTVRVRAVGVTAMISVALLGLPGLVPVPFRTQAEGVVWVPEESFVRAGVDGFVEDVVVEPGAQVRKGEILIVCRDPVLSAEVRVGEARRRELQALYDKHRVDDLVEAQKVEEELRYAEQELAQARERESELVIRSGTDGTFVVPSAENLPGRFVHKGEHLAYVVNLNTVTVRTVIPQADIDLVRYQTRKVEAWLAERIGDTLSAALTRIVPSATQRLPSTALGVQGGGQIRVDPSDPTGAKAVDKLFQVEMELPARTPVVNTGGRVYIRFDHGRKPLLWQWYRKLRQLFLSYFNV